MSKDCTIELNATDIGPHEALAFKTVLGSLEMGLYANNGSGKTFLSRIFRLASKQELTVNDSNKLISIGKPEGKFLFKVTNTKEPGVIRELAIELKRDTIPAILTDSTQYIFRVFNDDYVKENLEELNFKPNGEIEGYILGKDKIDLTKEKEKLELLTNEIKTIEEGIRVEGRKLMAELDKLEISKNTTEYKQIRFENLFNPSIVLAETENFETLVEIFNKFKSIPENLADISTIPLIEDQTNRFNSITNFLATSFSRSILAEEFKNKVKAKQSFIELGLQLKTSHNNECPFCEQTLGDKSLKLIDQYNAFLSESEAKQIKHADSLIQDLSGFRTQMKELHARVLQTVELYRRLLQYVPSLADTSLYSFQDFREVDNSVNLIIETLNRKKNDISLNLSSVELNSAFQVIKAWCIMANDAIVADNSSIVNFNSRKSNINAERIELNRRLCRATFWKLLNSQDSGIKNFINLSEKIKFTSEEITKKEQTAKISKKDKVVETFKELLTAFFGTKYSFDETTFCLKFQNLLLTSNAMDVLSTGEKSIIAFCYFIAETHTIVEIEDDYQRLFFIIDDPISSQDFHFVYATSQKIRNLNKFFGIKRLRLLLLTHNLEFMSILIRNKVIEQKFILNGGRIDRIGNELIMPYEHHLRDISDIVTKSKKPSHTTPNSLRHVLETLNRFIAPDVGLAEFCEMIEGFQENEFLYTMIHDQSHGGIRIQKAYTEEMIIKACDIVINYIAKDFSGQLKVIAVA